MTAPDVRDQDPEVRGQLALARDAWGAGRREEATRRWRTLAVGHPDVAAPYVNLARAGGPGREARMSAAAAVLAAGDHLVYRNLGILAQARGAAEVAASCLRRATILAPADPLTAGALAKLGALPSGGTAARCWSLRAVLADPLRWDSWIDLLARLSAAGRHDAGARLLAAHPAPLETWPATLLRPAAETLAKAGRHAAALPVLVRLTAAEPFNVPARMLRAAMHRRTGDQPAAVRQARMAVIAAPSVFDGYGALGTELARSNLHAEAVQVYRRALRIRCDRRAEVLENYGAALVKTDLAADAARILKEAVLHRPDRGTSYLNYSILAVQAAELDTAARFGRFAVIARPDVAGAHYNLGSVRRHQGRIDEARRLLDRAGEIEDNPSHRFVRAMLELGDGDAEDGLRRYEVRWDVPGFASTRRMGATPTLQVPAWGGEPLPAATVAVWAEQGIGDEIWFSGYLDWARGRVGRVVAEVAGSLQPLLRRSFPQIEFRVRGAPGTEEAMSSADLQAPMGSLLLLSGAARRPVPTGYLRPDPERVRRLRDLYTGGRPDRRVIGISWRSVKPVRNRSFEAALEAWGPLFALDDTVFLSVQYGATAADTRIVRERFGCELVRDPDIDAYQDLDALAAQVAATDAVVTVANSTVALAHGLGRRAYVLTRRIQDDWRYTRGQEQARWLPTARCFWQSDAADWRTPITRIAERLRRDG